MALEGTLKDLHVQDVFQLLDLGRKSGTLRVTSELRQTAATICFERGGVVAAALGGVRPHLMVTDPPYGVEYDPAWRNRAGVSTSKRTGKVENDDRADWRQAWALFPGEVA